MGYHYNPEQALEELNEDALLPNPVHVRDMIFRAKLSPVVAVEIDREFESYLSQFGDCQRLVRNILERLSRAATSRR
jgi:hypothetical protein